MGEELPEKKKRKKKEKNPNHQQEEMRTEGVPPFLYKWVPRQVKAHFGGKCMVGILPSVLTEKLTLSERNYPALPA